MKEFATISMALAKAQRKWMKTQETITVLTEQIQQAHTLESALKEIVNHEIDLSKPEDQQRFVYDEDVSAIYRYAISAAEMDPRSGEHLLSQIEIGYNPPTELVQRLIFLLADKLDQKFTYIETLIELIVTE